MRSCRAKFVARAGFLTLAVLSVVMSACSPAPDRPPNVLLIVVDTLRADHVGCYGAERDTSPHIDALAADAVRFERAYSTAPWTMPSVASMITGLYPNRHTAISFNRRLPDDVDTLAEILKTHGYATAGVISHTAIAARHNFQQGFDVYLEDEAQGHEHISTEGVTRQAIEQLDRMAAADQPFFLFVHYFDPHYSYMPHDGIDFAPQGGVGRLVGGEKMRNVRLIEDLTDDEIEFLTALYDEEIRYTDRGIGRLLDRFDELELRDETVIVLTADHGEEFMTHGRLGHTRTLYDDLVHVPLIVRGTQATGRGTVWPDPVSLVALTPTVLDLLEIQDPLRRFQAESLRPMLEGHAIEEQPLVYIEVDFVPLREARQSSDFTVHKKAAVEGWLKLIRDDNESRLELYDLESDPHELTDLIDERPGDAANLEPTLIRAIELAKSGALAAADVELSDSEVERLRGLGYVGD